MGVCRIQLQRFQTFAQILDVNQIPYLPTTPLGQDMMQGQFLSGV